MHLNLKLMKNYLKPHILFTAATILLLMAACQSQNDITSVNAARSFFENNATVLSLPNIAHFQTKSDGLNRYLQSVSPAWNDAIVTEKNGNTLVEVPLSGAVKVVGAIVTIDNGVYDICRATAKSYLVFDFCEPTPVIYVETFLQKGNKCTMTADSERKRITGFQIISNLDGRILEKTGFKNGNTRSVSDQHYLIDITHIKQVDYFGYRMAYAMAETKSGCPGYEEWLLCPNCVTHFWGNTDDPDLQCPHCGHFMYDTGDVYCHKCGHYLYECTCPNSEVCGPCNQLKLQCNEDCSSSPYCTCDGGHH